jgi:hypothetical protein
MEMKRNFPINSKVGDDLESNRTDKISRVVKKDGQLARSPELIAMPSLCWFSTCDPTAQATYSVICNLTFCWESQSLKCAEPNSSSQLVHLIYSYTSKVSPEHLTYQNRESCSFSPSSTKFQEKKPKQLLTSSQNAHRFFHHTDTISGGRRRKMERQLTRSSQLIAMHRSLS